MKVMIKYDFNALPTFYSGRQHLSLLQLDSLCLVSTWRELSSSVRVEFVVFLFFAVVLANQKVWSKIIIKPLISITYMLKWNAQPSLNVLSHTS